MQIRGGAAGEEGADDLQGMPFHQCVATIQHGRLQYDKASIKKVMSRLELDGGQKSGEAASERRRYHRAHPGAMALTSNSEFKGDAAATLQRLCQVEAHDAPVLSRIIRTIELRLEDSAGLKWRHALKGLLLLRALLIYGPEVRYTIPISDLLGSASIDTHLLVL